MRDKFAYDVQVEASGDASGVSISKISDANLATGMIQFTSSIPDASCFLSNQAIKSVSAMFRWAEMSRDLPVATAE